MLSIRIDKRTIIALVMTFSTSPVMAQENLFDLPIEELLKIKVSTVSRVDESLDRSAGSIYVFPREVIQKRGYRSLGELLQVVPGFTVFHKDLQYVAGVRGLNANDNEKVTLLINGQELNQVNEPDYLNGPINLDNVEKVEIVVGPSSFFQQANTLAATINVITKNVKGVETIFASGNYLPYSATVMAGKDWGNNKRANFSFTTEQKKGFDAFSSDFRPNLAGRDQVGKLEFPSFFSVLNGQSGSWYGQAVAYRSKQSELLINNGDRGNDAQLVDQFYSVFLKNEPQLTSSLQGVFRAAVTRKEQSRMNQKGTPVNALQQMIKQWAYNSELGVRYKGFNRHLIQTGVQGTYENNFDTWYNINQTNPPLVRPTTTLVNKDTYALGVYADDTFQMNEKLKLIAGLRMDKNTRLPNERWYVGNRAAVIVDASKNWISKLIYNRAVRMPSTLASLNKAWGSDKPDAPPFAQFSRNANEPEILSTVELQNIFYAKGFRLGTTIYHQELKDFISWLEPHTNVGKFKGNGAEVSLETALSSNIGLWANGSYNDSQLFAVVPPSSSTIEQHHVEVNDELRIIGAPKYTANLGLDHVLAKDLIFSPAIRYFTRQAAYNFTSQKFITINDRYYLDAALTWKNLKTFKDSEMDLRLSGQNLLANREQVGGQWIRDTYRPRGTSVVLALELRL